MGSQLRKRSAAGPSSNGVRVDGFHTVHKIDQRGRPKCNISTGCQEDGHFIPTDHAPDCIRCLKRPPTKHQKAYAQGWRHGTKGEIKQGPANQKNEVLRAAYRQGFEHGVNDYENAEHHGEQHYRSDT